MAKGSPFMGTLTGKLGETVGMRRNGKQVFRAYVPNPKNPNSQKQQVQRMVQATAAQAYSAMKQICDHSFEGVQVGQKSMSYFMSKNMDLLRASIRAEADGTLLGSSMDFVSRGVNLPVINPYVISKGTLPEVVLYDAIAPSTPAFDPTSEVGIAIGSNDDVTEVIDNFVVNNSGEIGDWFTFCFMFKVNDSILNGQQEYRFGFIRFVVKNVVSSSGTKLTLFPSLTNFGIPPADAADYFTHSSVGETDDYVTFLDVSRLISNMGDLQGQFIIAACAVIHSRQNVSGSWQRSNATMVVRSQFPTLGIVWPADFSGELASYSGSAQAKGVGDYVLNGGI